jgi:AAA domain
MSSSQRALPFIALSKLMSGDYREQVVARALNFRQQATQTIQRRADRTFDKLLQVDGFRHASKAPIGRLQKEVLRWLPYDPELATVIINLWLESHVELETAYRAFLNEREDEVNEVFTMEDGQVGALSTEAREINAEFAEKNEKYDENDIALMLCCLTDEIWAQKDETTVEEEFVEDEVQPEEKVNDRLAESNASLSPRDHEHLLGEFWQPWLDVLESLPADAKEWTEIDKFVDAVQQLAIKKRKQTEQSREYLRSVIETMLLEAVDEAAYFGFEDCTSWNSEACSSDEATVVADKVVKLHEVLKRHSLLRSHTAVTLSEERMRRKEMSELEGQALHLYEDISARLSYKNTLSGELAASSQFSEQPTSLANRDGNPDLPAIKSPPELGKTTVPDVETQVNVAQDRADCTPLVDAKASFVDGGAGGVEEAQAVLSTSLSNTISKSEADIDETEEAAASQIPPPYSTQEESTPPLQLSSQTLTESPEEGQINTAENDRDIVWDELLWELIKEDDLAAAYWLARSLEATSLGSTVPAWLIASIQGARWLTAESYALVHDLSEISRSHQLESKNQALELLGIAAGLRSTLIAPNTGLQEWLKRTNHSPALNRLTAAVKEFAGFGKPFRPGTETDVVGKQSTRRARIVGETEKWLAEAPMHRAKNKGATDVWRRLVTSGGDIWEMLSPISQDRRHAEQQVKQKLGQLENLDFVSNRIDELHSETVHGRKVQPIEGAPRQQLIRDVQEACGLAKQWLAVLDQEREIDTRGDWLDLQITRLKSLVMETLPLAEAELKAINDAPQSDMGASAAVQCLIRSLHYFRLLFHSSESEISFEQNEHEINVLGDERLLVRLARRLLWLPEINIDDDGQPVLNNPILLALSLQKSVAESRTLEEAFEGWLQKQDYRFAAQVIEAISAKKETADIVRRLATAVEASRSVLADNIARTLEAVEQAIVDGIIADAQRAEFSAELESIDVGGVMNFHAVSSRLESIKTQLADSHKQRLLDLSIKWQQVKSYIDERKETGKFERASSFVKKAFEQGDTRVVDECLARISEMAEGGEFEDNWFASVTKRDILGEFLRASSYIEPWLQQSPDALTNLPAIIDAGSSIGSWKIDELLPTRRREVSDAVKAWGELKKRGSRPKEVGMYLAVVLRYLGFTFAGNESAAVRVERREADWLHARASASSSDLAKPIPQFGSLSNDNYEVLCLWGRPSVDAMGARLHEARLDGRSLIVFYFGLLTRNERIKVARLTRERELSVVILDDMLLTFLAGEKDARLRAFLPCALPFSALNPYTPFQAGDVPPEMFFGREAMARELRRPAGSCIVYGGRQLGKSALLRHVQREFNQPKQEQYALVEDIKMIGDAHSGQPTDAIWRKIREGFVRLGLMKRTTDKPDEIRRSVRQTMLHSPRCFVLIMFDEADNFLDADSADGFRVVTELRSLMTATDRRFKVVFAGLQNVQRFQGIPNQPLAHFGRPVLVGPLEPKAAQDLVREPFESLGYRFADDATVLRILSYTNYHAGLIQLFCQELLRRLHTRLEDAAPPYFVEQADVEGVYRTRQVRESIRERFDWTLALNVRYQAIAWVMIADQMSEHDSYSRAYSAGRIRQLVEFWWEPGFSGISSDQMHGLLDEMCGLGVLVRDGSGHYRLRSPNLVRLMGTAEDIGNRLVELSQKPPEVKYDADSHHAQLDESKQSYSPLTYAQERALNPAQFGVGLVFASEALGFNFLEESVKRFIPSDLPADVQSEYAIIPPEVGTAAEIGGWLHTFLENRHKYERLIACQKVNGITQNIDERVREALRFCRTRRSQKQWMRVIFLFDSQAAWQWLLLPLQMRIELEEQVDAVTSTRRWNLHGIRQRLSQENKMHSDEVCQEVLRVTGGWLWLLDVLLKRCVSDDPRGCALSIEQELTNADNELSQKWRDILFQKINPLPFRVLRFISSEQDEQGVPRDLVVPELIGGEPLIQPAECDAAVEYLQRMGLVDLLGEAVRAEPVVRRTIIIDN